MYRKNWNFKFKKIVYNNKQRNKNLKNILLQLKPKEYKLVGLGPWAISVTFVTMNFFEKKKKLQIIWSSICIQKIKNI